jgi:2-methylfumaryl-CoA hydratase
MTLQNKNSVGNFFEDFSLNQKIDHATPRTITHGDVALYTALYGTRFALHSSNEFAKNLALRESPIDDFLLFNIAFGKTVPDISLNALANLGYADCKFLKLVYPGDTIKSTSHVIGLKENSNGETGVVYVNSICTNQNNEVVLDFKRWVMVKKKNKGSLDTKTTLPELPNELSKVDIQEIALSYNFDLNNFNHTDSGSTVSFEDFTVGEKIDHIDGMTVEESEHMLATKLYQNTAKVHFNHYYEKEGRFGKRIVYGGHVISLVRSLSFNGLANAFKIVGINGGSHAAPCFAGKTVFSWSEIIDVLDINENIGAIRIKTNGIGDAPASDFQDKNEDGKFNQNVLLSLDYWALIPKKK